MQYLCTLLVYNIKKLYLLGPAFNKRFVKIHIVHILTFVNLLITYVFELLYSYSFGFLGVNDKLSWISF